MIAVQTKVGVWSLTNSVTLSQFYLFIGCRLKGREKLKKTICLEEIIFPFTKRRKTERRTALKTNKQTNITKQTKPRRVLFEH